MVEWRKQCQATADAQQMVAVSAGSVMYKATELPDEHSSVSVGAQTGAQARSDGDANHDGMEHLAAIPAGKDQLTILHSSADNSLYSGRLKAKTVPCGIVQKTLLCLTCSA